MPRSLPEIDRDLTGVVRDWKRARRKNDLAQEITHWQAIDALLKERSAVTHAAAGGTGPGLAAQGQAAAARG